MYDTHVEHSISACINKKKTNNSNHWWQYGSLQHKITKRSEIQFRNSQAVKKFATPNKAIVKKRCEFQGGGQEMAVMVG